MASSAQLLSAQLLSHIISRITLDLEFLSDHSFISLTDLQLIKSRLPSTNSSTPSTQTNSLTSGISNLAVIHGTDEEDRTIGSTASTSNGIRDRKVSATWSYDSTTPDDLSFVTGDIITVVEQVNPEWARGTCNGRLGLFPTNHVEPFNSAPPLPPRLINSSSFQNNNFSSPPFNPSSSAPYYQPQNSPYPSPAPSSPYYQPLQQQQSYDFPPPPPPPSQQYQSYHPAGLTPYSPSPPPPQQYLQQQQQQQQPYTNGENQGGPPPIPKKPRFGKFGNQMASSFAGGIGFGAGMAIAGDVVNAIL